MAPLEEGKFKAITLTVGQEDSQHHSQSIGINLHDLLSQPEIVVNNLVYLNPLLLLSDHQCMQKVHRLGFLLHGDLQQSNAI